MIPPTDANRIRNAFHAGKLRIRSIAPDGRIEWRPIIRVGRTPLGSREMVEVTTEQGPGRLTADHKIYVSPTDRVPAADLKRGDTVLRIRDDRLDTQRVLWVKPSHRDQYVYNLTVPPHCNFAVGWLGGLANSPDKFYHFRPPEHEGRVGKFDRVFGQIWEDRELLLYLRAAIDDWTLVPPNTDQVRTIDEVWGRYPGWRAGIRWGAMIHALFAVMLNWIADEFDYSIGGVSLSIEKSSKYQSALGDAKDMWDKAAEGKTRTTLYILGLKQPRFGVGVRSAFGPYVRGTLGPRAFTMSFPILMYLGHLAQTFLT